MTIVRIRLEIARFRNWIVRFRDQIVHFRGFIVPDRAIACSIEAWREKQTVIGVWQILEKVYLRIGWPVGRAWTERAVFLFADGSQAVPESHMAQTGR